MHANMHTFYCCISVKVGKIVHDTGGNVSCKLVQMDCLHVKFVVLNALIEISTASLLYLYTRLIHEQTYKQFTRIVIWQPCGGGWK